MNRPGLASERRPWHPIKFPDDIILYDHVLVGLQPWHPIKFPDDIIGRWLAIETARPWHPIKFPDDIIRPCARRLSTRALAPYQIPG